jgi:23S rRNA (guanosine2251-2'-O)-methyltransferase
MGSGRELILIGGLHDVRAALDRLGDDVDGVWIDARRDDRRMREILRLAEGRGIPVVRVSRRELDAMAGALRHQGVLAKCRGAVALDAAGLPTFVANLDHEPLLLVLDGVQDPHNLGACLRTADGAGVDAVIVPADSACGITPVVSRVAAGAAHSMPFYQVTNLARTLETLQAAGIWITGAADDAAMDLWEADLTGPAAIVLGAEGSGLRELTRRHCDHLVRIPMAGRVESLNVSVAAGVVLYEALRQRRTGSTA